MQSKSSALPDGTRLGPVHLRVTDICNVAALWRDIIGLEVIADAGETMELGVGGRPMIVLHAGADAAATPKARGLFHVAVHVPSRHELARTAARFRASGLRHAAQDHLVSESLYIADADGNGIEVCLETPRRGRVEVADGQVRAVAIDGSVHSGLEPLDLEHLLTELPAGEPVDGPLPAETFIGHIHLRARNPQALLAFYAGVIGLTAYVQSPSFGMYDFGTPGKPHVVAFNTWAGADLVEPHAGAAGLASFTIEVPSAELLAALGERLRSAGTAIGTDAGALLCTDPEGNRINLSVMGR